MPPAASSSSRGTRRCGRRVRRWSTPRPLRDEPRTGAAAPPRERPDATALGARATNVVIADGDRRCRPAASRFAGSSHASVGEATAGQRSSIRACQAVTRDRPFTTMCRRPTPSKVKPGRPAARRLATLRSSHFPSTRRYPRSKRSPITSRSASVAAAVRASAAPRTMPPTSTRRSTGAIRMRASTPAASGRSASAGTASTSGSFPAAAPRSPRANNVRSAKGPIRMNRGCPASPSSTGAAARRSPGAADRGARAARAILRARGRPAAAARLRRPTAGSGRSRSVGHQLAHDRAPAARPPHAERAGGETRDLDARRHAPPGAVDELETRAVVGAAPHPATGHLEAR